MTGLYHISDKIETYNFRGVPQPNLFIAIKKEKAVTLSPLLPCVYDSFPLIYGCPGWVS
jgi:hypothetical protein